MSLHLVVPAPGAEDPALPVLQRLMGLARSERRDAGWRAGLLADLWPGTAASSPARIAALAIADPAGDAVCFAQPVHLLAGLSRVHLHPDGLLRVDAQEAQQLCSTFEQDLGQPGWKLHVAGEGLLLSGTMDSDDAGEARDPARQRGRELGPASLAGSASLRRLAAETEMWLHAHPLNAARQARGALAVTALWFWGAARSSGPGLPEIRKAPIWRAGGEDPFLTGLQAAGMTRPLPEASPLTSVGRTDDCIVMIDSASAVDRWLLPAYEALQARALDEVVLHVDTRRMQLAPPGWRHRLRGVWAQGVRA